MMNDIFEVKMAQEWLLGYMDDLLIPSEGSREELAERGALVLDKCEANNLFIQPEKSEFFTTDVGFLGFQIHDGLLAIEEQKVAGIADWPPPQNTTQVKSFIGFCNFYK